MNVWKTTIRRNDGTLEIGWRGSYQGAYEIGFQHIINKSGRLERPIEKHTIRCSSSGVVAALNRFATNIQTEGQP